MSDNSALAKRTATIADVLGQKRDQIKNALPAHMTPDKMLRITMTSIAKNRDLLKCTMESLTGCVLECAQLGLYPDGAMGHAYLIPYKEKCTLIVGYRGLIDLARRSGQVESIHARVVYENDEFDFEYGGGPFIRHKPAWKDDPGAPIGAYAVASLKGGEQVFEVMNRNEIEAIRQRSKAKNSGPWITDTTEMWRKTVVRRLAKYLPMSAELERSVRREEAMDRGEDESFIDGAITVVGEDDDPLDTIAKKFEGKKGRISSEEVELFDSKMEEMLKRGMEIRNESEVSAGYKEAYSKYNPHKPSRNDMKAALVAMAELLEGWEKEKGAAVPDGDDDPY